MSESDTSVMNPDMFYQAEPEPIEKKAIAPTDEAPNQEPEVEDVETVEPEKAQDAVETETIESEESELEPSDEELFVQIGEQELSVKEIKELQKGNLRQSDYTKKTQKLADERRLYEADKQSEVNKVVVEKLEGFDDLTATLEALVAEADESIDWDDLRQYDIGEYTKQKELKDKRIQAIADAKLIRENQSKIEVSPEDTQREQQILSDKNPHWIKDGKPTEAHKKDLELLSGYLDKNGYTVEEQKLISTAKHWQTLLDAARYRASLEKVSEIKKQVKKIPLVTRPKKTTPKKTGSFADKFYDS